MNPSTLLHACLCLCLLAPAFGAEPDEGIPFPVTGKIQPRHARDIAGSNWSVGAETIDRDYTIYANWKSYLGPLGVKKARIQGGWAKTEKQQGVYDFAWLDAVIFDMAKQGVEPWLSLSYGNPIYEGGGDPQIKGRVPTSEIGLRAWANWVKATVARYQHVIDEWEVWNEPNYSIAPADYARLLVVTADAVRAVQSKAILVGFALGSRVDHVYAAKVLELLKQQGRLDALDQISHHRHQANPDERGNELELEKLVSSYGNRYAIRQGEAGCPSEFGDQFAMKNYPWTETMQAKHVLRRLLGDLGRDKESSVFAIVDMNYAHLGTMNRKGLLRAREDRTVERPKPAYFAVQHLTAVFDDRLQRLKELRHESSPALPLSAYGYRHTAGGGTIITIWLHDRIPADEHRKTAVNLKFPGVNFIEPVYVDLRTGRVYELPRERWSQQGGGANFQQILVYDSPVLIADRATLPLQP